MDKTNNFKLESLRKQINFIKSKTSKEIYRIGRDFYEYDNVQILSQGKDYYEFDVEDKDTIYGVSVDIVEEDVDIVGEDIDIVEEDKNTFRYELSCKCKSKEICTHRIAVLISLEEIFIDYASKTTKFNMLSGKQYTREGMIKRVLEERRKKAFSEKFRLSFSKNIYGEHLLETERGIKYKLTFRDYKNEKGYCTCPDYRKNKLGTCKHLIYAFSELEKQRLSKFNLTHYPFVDVFLNPLNNTQIKYFYPNNLDVNTQAIFDIYFDKKGDFCKENVTDFLHFIKQTEDFENIHIRTEVFDLVEQTFDKNIIKQLEQSTKMDLSSIKATLYPYQKEGIEFATYKKGAIIADEMGLGKTLQAIGTAITKKQIFGFERCLIICPASLKDQWKSEIEKFSDEKATIVYGFPEQREEIYVSDTNYFHIINYETVLRDKDIINKLGYDFIILDEAQRIKNYETITANAVKALHKKHGLVITGTPIENKLIDLYSIVEFLDKKMLTPMWEFSYQHCYFDKTSKNKITGYTNLQNLKNKIKSVLLRRTKKEVIEQLHNLNEITIPVAMHPKQRELHASYARGVAKILGKKFKTSFDWQKLTMLLQSMRMVCNSTYLIDNETNFSPKLTELKDVLFEKLDLKNNHRKIIIFSEWIKSNKLIGDLLRENNIGYTELNGKVPVKKRQALINEFEQNKKCRVFLSTESGGSGLNLQMADTVINFELPWNPAKKNQRIGRIDRLGQKNKALTVVNFITKNSIEMKIASGLMAKQELFDNVLNYDSTMQTVDFSNKGRAQFLQELELSMQEFTTDDIEKQSAEVFEEDVVEPITKEEQQTVSEEQKQEKIERTKKLEEMEAVMNKGMDFLAGMFKMATGNDLKSDSNKIEIDKKTGEVVMRFKVDF